ncbi:distal tail protein Dit [uncultured Clostridium sp.]|uniref:distal tail protein Dit n=1 Tax=uncultured Clostridium sp. TaxID=59620 RepID=UPI00260440B2|nr:distal tail protein Dit [uncultured Clostridium sp.]
MKYLEFNNRSSEDFKLGIIKVNIGTPVPNLITETIPYSNGTLDFSTVATGGLKTFSDRTITIDFNYIGDTIEDLYNRFSEISSWLLGGVKGDIIFNYIDGTYTGQCTQISTLDSFISFGKFTATFSCYPFLDTGNYGDYLWDPFSFEDGIVADEWIVNTGDIIKIDIKGIDVNPLIAASKDLTISLNNKNYNLKMGDNKIFGLLFKNGVNEILIANADKASINFTFKKETI